MLGWDNPYPERKPFALYDKYGMKVACSILMRSLAKRKHVKEIQYTIMHKMRGHISNCMYTFPRGVGANLVRLDNNIGLISSSPTHTE